MTDISSIRNFAIIAHIDHGKSTLADRLIQTCGGLSERAMRSQVLDNMELERERGITIKAQTVRLDYAAPDGERFQLNLIDTPGHVDFSYEVSRSLAACEGSVLIVDASQGVEAQTLANVYQAVDMNHDIVVVLNKIDLPAADPDRVKAQIEEVVGLPAHDAVEVSAKTGQGVEAVLAAIVGRIKPPQGARDAPLKAMLVDSRFDPYLGVVVLTRVMQGELRTGRRIQMLSSGSGYGVDQVGVFRPDIEDTGVLGPGEIGFFTASIRAVTQTRVGDTITDEAKPCAEALPGFKTVQPVVFCGFFPLDSARFTDLRDAMAKLRLNDASFSFETESSAALGFGFRCGFLGLLHLEIIRERIEREFGIEVVTTSPGVVYKVFLADGGCQEISNAADMPDPGRIDHIEEPWIQASILSPDSSLGAVLGLCEERRGRQITIESSSGRSMVSYALPLNEVVYDFHDRLKSVSRGYASLDYQLGEYETGDLVRMNILVNGDPVDALTFIAHRSRAEARGRTMCERLKELIPRHLFKIPIQAAIGSRVVARETIPAMRKDVTAKCYGGDVSRKRKLLEKQKAGKKKMRRFGRVEIPQEAFIESLKSSR